MEDSKTGLVNKCHFLVACIGVVIILTSLTVYIGTLYNIPAVTNISSSWINMKINTAICLFLAGVVLCLMNNNYRGFYSDLTIAVASTIILLISCMTVIEYVFNVDLSIDQLLIKENLPLGPGTLYPGRMTFMSAMNFILVTFAFIFVLKKSISIWAIQTLAWLILLIALVSLLNYVYGTDQISYYAKYTTMAIETTVLFILISFGILLIKPYEGIVNLILQNSSGGYLLRRLLPIIFFVPVFVNLLESYLQRRGFIDEASGNIFIVTTSFILTGIMILLLARIIDNKEKKLVNAQVQAQHNEMIFRRFAENIDIVFYTTTSDLSQILYVSPAYEKIWGKSTESLYKNPKDWFESIIPEDRGKTHEAFFVGLQKGDTNISSEYRIKRPDGSLRHIFARIFQVKEENRSVFCVIGIAVDMTDIKNEKLYKKIQYDLVTLIEVEKSLYEFIPKLLKMLCCSFKWEVGELWLIDETRNILSCVNSWHEDTKALNDFDSKSRQYSFHFGDGLPGKVWKTKQPTWTNNYSSDSVFSRSNAAAMAGLTSTIGIPIVYQNKIFGIIEFFSCNMINPDNEFLTLIEIIGKSIGDFIGRIYTSDKLKNISRSDLITGLLNRSALEENLDNCIREGKSQSITTMMLDIDRFRFVNEALGHEYGDLLLKLVAKTFDEFTNHQHNLARLGADKFILYLPEIDRDSALDYAHLIMNRFKEPFNIGEHKTILSLTIGIAIYPQNGLDSKTLVTNANLAMARAKELGGNRIKFFTVDLPYIASKIMTMDVDLHQAMIKNQFIMEYQPQIDLHSGNICAAEALVRWQHPISGLLRPGAFIPFAEKVGLIVALNEHILRLVFQQIGPNWSGPPISVNISVQQFKDGFHFVEYLESLMNEFSVSSKHVELEIVENILIEDTEHNIAILTALHELGFQIAIDDFGTGFSSFGYLNRLPVQKIKVDRAFISGLPGNLANAKIVKGIISMVHALDMKMLAEGAETAAEVEFLKQENCDIIQGFYYYKPMPFNDYMALLTAQQNRTDMPDTSARSEGFS